MNVDEAIKEFGVFLQSIRFDIHDNSPLISRDIISFSDDEGRWTTLYDQEAIEFRQCLAHLTESVKEEDLYSKKGLEGIMKSVIMEAVKAGGDKFSDAAIKAAKKQLKAVLESPPAAYVIHVPVVGVDPKCTPVSIGGLTFDYHGGDPLELIKGAVGNLISTTRNSSKDTHGFMMKEIDKNFAGRVVARLKVVAGDEYHASAKGLAICRQVIDAINFFSDLLMPGGIRAGIAILGEGPQAANLDPNFYVKATLSLAESRSPDPKFPDYLGGRMESFSLNTYPTGPLLGWSLPRADNPSPSTGPHANLMKAFARMSQIASSEKRNTLEKRIWSALQWAGRAKTSFRNDESFTKHMIALESLLLDKNKKSEIALRLQLKLAHLVGETGQQRIAIADDLNELYKTRSNIVHSGEFQVTDADLQKLSLIVTLALIVTLSVPPFSEMVDAKIFDCHLNKQMISGGRPQNAGEQKPPEGPKNRESGRPSDLRVRHVQ